ncbi:hypothetical protein [Flavobacterium suzhouense]|uniref:Lipoprotein n=1 Tax=Flavobacterium suzhouense TaxID=1529638 RepID=A0ABW5NP96_9FLAO
MKAKFILFVAALALVSIACEEEETTNVSGDNCLDEVENLSNILLEKTSALSSNQTVANCQAYKTAWFNVYNKMKSCGYATTELDQTKTVVEEMDCSVFD